MVFILFSPHSDLNPTKNSGPVIIHASKCEKYGMCRGAGSSQLAQHRGARAEAGPRAAGCPGLCPVTPRSKGAILEAPEALGGGVCSPVPW